MRSARFVVIGAGFAGAATAFFLTQHGAEHVTILERERIPGVHASGRNAAMVRQVVDDPAIATMASEGRRFIHDWSRRTSDSHFHQTGSMLLGGPDLSVRFDQHIRRDSPLAEAEVLTRRHAAMQVHLLRNADFECTVWCKSDGVVDTSALLQHYLDEACQGDAKLILHAPVSRIEIIEGAVRSVRAGKNTIPCDVLINASGAWATQIGELAGSSCMPLPSYRRHLLCSHPIKNINSDWPFVWDIRNGIYFRPESNGLLLSPCDHTEHDPCLPRLDEGAIDLLATKLQRHVPDLASIGIANGWAGLRTIASDNKFVIGWDKSVQGFFWVAGLGGHGVTCSAAVGKLAADLLLGQKSNSNAFDPSRLCPEVVQHGKSDLS